MIAYREMTRADISQVAEMERGIFSMPWSEQGFLEALEDPKGVYVLAIDENVEGQEKIVGYCGLYLILEEGYINQVAVAKDYRGRHIGYEMVNYMLALSKEKGMLACSLEVRVSNQTAIRLYEKCGFVSEGIRKNFYEKPAEDAMIMWKR